MERVVVMANEKTGFENNAEFWNWLKNRDAEPDILVPLELTIDNRPVPPKDSETGGTGTYEISNQFEISHDVSFEISGNVVYELRRS